MSNSFLLRSTYRTMLREAAWYDRRPLAKALLAPAPESLWDPSTSLWRNVVKDPSSTQLELTKYFGGKGFYLPHICENSLAQHIRREARQSNKSKKSSAVDMNSLFAYIRRLSQTKGLHAKYTLPEIPECNTIPPCKPELFYDVANCLRTAETSNQIIGTVLLGHPANFDWTSQSLIVLHSVYRGETVHGFVLNAPVTKERMLSWLWRCDLSMKHLAEIYHNVCEKMVVYDGGPMHEEPQVLHSVAGIPQGYTLPGGMYVHYLKDLLQADKVTEELCLARDTRLIVNQCTWAIPQLLGELQHNWWIPIRGGDYLKSLLQSETDLETTSPPVLKEGALTSWQRTMLALGGGYEDFARLKVLSGQELDDAYYELRNTWKTEGTEFTLETDLGEEEFEEGF